MQPLPVFPSDHYVRHSDALRQTIERMCRVVAGFPRKIALLGRASGARRWRGHPQDAHVVLTQQPVAAAVAAERFAEEIVPFREDRERTMRVSPPPLYQPAVAPQGRRKMRLSARGHSM